MYDNDDLFADRVAAPLRAPESADPTFTARVMAVVQAEAAARPVTSAMNPMDATRRTPGAIHAVATETRSARTRHWWQRSVTVRLTPAGALALAAGIAMVVVLGDRTLRRALPQHPVVAASRTVASAAPAPRTVVQHDTTYIVRFMLMAPSASSVALVGDFNNWNRGATRLVPTGQRGVWTVSLPLPAGKHEYAFIVDSTRWTADPHATLTVADDFGTESSIITVGTRAPSPTT